MFSLSSFTELRLSLRKVRSKTTSIVSKKHTQPLISWINHGTDSEQDIQNLIERTEQAAATTESLTSESGLKFDFAKIWEPTRGSLEEVTEDAGQIQGDDDFWAKLLEQSKQKEEEENEKMGRGARRKAAAAVTTVSPPISMIFHLIPSIS